MKSIFAVRIILAALAMAAPAAVHAQLAKCVAKDGKVEYARECPAGTTEQSIRTGPTGSAGAGNAGAGSPGAASSPPAPKSVAERDAAFKKRQIEQQEADQKGAKQAAEEQRKREQCDNAQNYVKTLESGLRVTRVDPKTGERIFIEDAERTAELNKARQAAAQNCK